MGTYSIDQKTMIKIVVVLAALGVLLFLFGLTIGLSISSSEDKPVVAESALVDKNETTEKDDEVTPSPDLPVSKAEYVPVQSQSDAKEAPAVEQELSQPKTTANK